jgi:hypothetical protein
MVNALKGHPEAAHFCGKEGCGTNVPGKSNPFCSAKGPLTGLDGAPLSCMRIAEHAGPHEVYQFSISTPAQWGEA